MSTEPSSTNLENVITAACNGLIGNFERLNGLMAEPHAEDMSATDIARNLAEFGHGQMSGEATPGDEDRDLIATIAANTDLDGVLAPRFCAYLCGCVLGWAAVGELDRAVVEDAFAIVRERSAELFPSAEEGDEASTASSPPKARS